MRSRRRIRRKPWAMLFGKIKFEKTVIVHHLYCPSLCASRFTTFSTFMFSCTCTYIIHHKQCKQYIVYYKAIGRTIGLKPIPCSTDWMPQSPPLDWPWARPTMAEASKPHLPRWWPTICSNHTEALMPCNQSAVSSPSSCQSAPVSRRPPTRNGSLSF